MDEDTLPFLSSVLAEDVRLSKERLLVHDTQSNRRDFVRTCVSGMEGLVWGMKQDFLLKHQDFAILRIQDELALSELNVIVRQNGEITTNTMSTSILVSIKMIEKLSRRIIKKSVIDTSSMEYQIFESVIQVRNRITHPKTMDAMKISKAEVDDSLKTFIWLGKRSVDLGRSLLSMKHAHSD